MEGTYREKCKEPLKLKVMINQEYKSLNVSPEANLFELKSVIHSVADVLPGSQKLIVEDRLLQDDHLTLISSNVMDNSTIMLFPFPGTEPENERRGKRLSGLLMDDSIVIKIGDKTVDRWMRTGIIGLSDFNFLEVPEEVWEVGISATLLDISKNSISKIPIDVRCLRSLETLLMNENKIADDSITWQGLVCLQSLTFLNLSANLLTSLPSELGSLTYLEKLYVSHNQLTSIPDEIGCLTHLQILKFDHNCLTAVPTSIGQCTSLIEIDLSSNNIENLPDTICDIEFLKVLKVRDNTTMESLPCNIFKMPTLKILDAGNTLIICEDLDKLT